MKRFVLLLTLALVLFSTPALAANSLYIEWTDGRISVIKDARSTKTATDDPNLLIVRYGSHGDDKLIINKTNLRWWHLGDNPPIDSTRK